MTRRQLLVRTTVAFLALGTVRGTVNAAWSATSAWNTAIVVFRALLISAIWIPVTLVVVRQWRKSQDVRGRVAWHLALLAAMALAEPLLVALVHGEAIDPRNFILRFDTNLVLIAAIVAAAWALTSREHELETRQNARALEATLAETELHVLTLQLHPHFLFNTLNLISQLVFDDATAARRILGNLRALLVESLRQAEHGESTVRDELRFLRAYLEIQQSRFRDRLSVSVSASPEIQNAAIPHLLLQPFVENAILHGIAPRRAVGHLDVVLEQRDGRLHIRITDDGVGAPLHFREGIGTTNSRHKLERVFGRDYRLDIVASPGGGTVTAIEFPCRPTRAVAPPETTARASLAVAPIPVNPIVPIVLGWTAVMLVWMQFIAVGRQLPYSAVAWREPSLANFVNAALWVALTPLVLSMARVLERGVQAPASRTLAHLGGGILIVGSHTVAWLAILHRFLPAEFTIALRQVFGWMIWDACAYAAIAGMATAVLCRERRRELVVAELEIHARLSVVRLARLRLRLQPAFLLDGLDCIDRAMGRSPEAAETMVARMGDLLRALLASCDRDTHALDDELAIAEAYAALVGGNAAAAALGAVRTALPPEAWSREVPGLSIAWMAAVLHGRLINAQVSLLPSAIIVVIDAPVDAIDRARLDDARVQILVLDDANEPQRVRLHLRLRLAESTTPSLHVAFA